MGSERDDEWLSTEQAAREIGGVTSRWVRYQIENHHLKARAILTGNRPTYRINRHDFEHFVAEFVVDDAADRDE